MWNYRQLPLCTQQGSHVTGNSLHCEAAAHRLAVPFILGPEASVVIRPPRPGGDLILFVHGFKAGMSNILSAIDPTKEGYS